MSSTSKFITYFNFILLAAIIGVQSYSLYVSRNVSFPGVWIARGTILILIVTFALTFIYSAFIHKATIDQIPSCTNITYFRFRWYVMLMAVISISAIPVYIAILQNTSQNRLIVQLASQIQVNLFFVLLSIAGDAFARYLAQKQSSSSSLSQSQPQERPQSPLQHQQTNTNPQFGYFSPKSKGPAPLASPSSQKHPFDSGKFRYAR